MNPQERRNILIPFDNYVILLFDSEFNKEDPMETSNGWVYDKNGRVLNFKPNTNLRRIIEEGKSLNDYIELFLDKTHSDFLDLDLREIGKILNHMTDKEKSELPTWFIGLFILKMLEIE